VREDPSPLTGLYLFVKRTLYTACRCLGLFALARRRARGKLRIITYHGFALEDESVFLPRTFIEPAVFRRRMELLKSKGYTVLGLEEALGLMEKNGLPPDPVVLTIDDGFYSTYKAAWPLLREFGYPATVYVTSYYAVKENPVFGLAVDYILWKTAAKEFDPAGLGLPFEGIRPLGGTRERSLLAREITLFGERELGEEERVALSKMLGERLGVDYRHIAESRILSIMSTAEIGEMAAAGIDIELHTHRHDIGTGREDAVREITECREVLEPAAGRRLEHFCYPGGRWEREHRGWLEELGIRSAATCDRGLNDRSTSRYELRRFGDDAALSTIEFEAELSGFAEMMRTAAARLTGRK
jgi:peptidoglycan/xylan/chitin deacetylase (PgdA/CDA1 family)